MPYLASENNTQPTSKIATSIASFLQIIGASVVKAQEAKSESYIRKHLL